MPRIATALLVLLPWSASATYLNLSFTGQVDGSGATIGGVAAPIGSLFSLDIVIDPSDVVIGSYTIRGMSYTTTVGAYETISTWVTPLEATQNGPSINLSSGGFEQNPTTEQFLLELTNFGPSFFDDPLSWTGASITGDILVRGIGGFDSPDQLSGMAPFSGTLSVSPSIVPVPASLLLFSSGLAILATFRRKLRMATDKLWPTHGLEPCRQIAS